VKPYAKRHVKVYADSGLDEAEVSAVLVVEAPRHSAAQFQPVLLELPHACPFLLPGRASALRRGE
jgi:hypothetical protein